MAPTMGEMAALAISPRALGSLLLILSGLVTARYPEATSATGTSASGTAIRVSSDQCRSNLSKGGMNAIHGRCDKRSSVPHQAALLGILRPAASPGEHR